jgi:hypothetical protein
MSFDLLLSSLHSAVGVNDSSFLFVRLRIVEVFLGTCASSLPSERLMKILEDEDRSFVEWAGPDSDPEEYSVSQARHALLLTGSWGALRRRR